MIFDLIGHQIIVYFCKKNEFMYPTELVTPMAKDLTDFGFQALETADKVDEVMNAGEGTSLVIVNSVCGCAAANARPAAKMALSYHKTPDNAYTVFAGVDKEATERMRDYLLPYPPSSPSIALFKDGKLVHMIERHHIEGRSAQMIAENLASAFEQYCN
jgi:putative YphP/YqiW family bacilliredoxin